MALHVDCRGGPRASLLASAVQACPAARGTLSRHKGPSPHPLRAHLRPASLRIKSKCTPGPPTPLPLLVLAPQPSRSPPLSASCHLRSLHAPLCPRLLCVPNRAQLPPRPHGTLGLLQSKQKHLLTKLVE